MAAGRLIHNTLILVAFLPLMAWGATLPRVIDLGADGTSGVPYCGWKATATTTALRTSPRATSMAMVLTTGSYVGPA
jgi:hypothetical protein